MSSQWEEVAVGDVAEIVMGQAPPGDTYNGHAVGTPFIQGCAEFGERNPTPVKWCSATNAKRAQAGDVLLSVRAPVGRINRAVSPLVIGRGIAAIRGGDRALTDFVELALAYREADLQSVSAGSTFAAVTKRHVNDLRIPLPPLEEQRRITHLANSIDGARAAALAEAVTAAALVRRLRDHYFAAPAAAVPLRDAVDVTIGRQRSPKHRSGDHMVPYLRAANVKDGFLALADVLTMNFTPAEQEKYSLRPGDILVTEGCGSLSQIGANAVWRGELAPPVCFQNTLLRLRAIEGRTIPSFVAHWARHAFDSGAFAEVSSGTNIFHIGAERAGGMLFPVVDLEQQAEIAQVLDGAENAARVAGDRADALAQLRAASIASLLSREHAIPRAYDRVMNTDENPADATLEPATA